MAVKKADAPLLDRIKEKVAEEGGFIPAGFRLTDKITVPPISLSQIEVLEKMGDVKDAEAVVPILRVLLGDVYDEAMKVIPLTLAQPVMEEIIRHQLPKEVADQFLEGID